MSLLYYSHKDGILSFRYNNRQKATSEYKSQKTDNTHIKTNSDGEEQGMVPQMVMVSNTIAAKWMARYQNIIMDGKIMTVNYE